MAEPRPAVNTRISGSSECPVCRNPSAVGGVRFPSAFAEILYIQTPRCLDFWPRGHRFSRCSATCIYRWVLCAPVVIPLYRGKARISTGGTVNTTASTGCGHDRRSAHADWHTVSHRRVGRHLRKWLVRRGCPECGRRSRKATRKLTAR